MCVLTDFPTAALEMDNIITNVVSTHHSRAQISYDAEKGLWSSFNSHLIGHPWVALLFLLVGRNFGEAAIGIWIDH